MSDWNVVTLGKIVTIRGGFSYKGKFIGSGESVLLGMGCVSFNETFLDAGARLYSGDCKESYLIKPGDIVLATRQQSDNLPILGVPALLPKKYQGRRVIVGTNLYQIFNDSEIGNDFFYWLLKSPAYKAHIRSRSKGTTVRMITKDAVESFSFKCPPKFERSWISAALWNIQKRIELNRQMNQTLEAMAQALFKSWFVDFDPVMDNALASGTKIPEALKAKAEKRQLVPDSKKLRQTNPELAKLFPSAFVYNEALGKWIPEGWEVKTLGEITTELRRGISPKYLDEGGVRVLNQKCIRNHEVDFSLARRNDPEKKKVDGRFLKPFDMVVNSTGTGTLGRVANIISLDEPTVVDSHVTILRPNVELVLRNYFNGLLFSIETTIEAMGEGSTGQTELSRARLSELNVLIAPKQIQKSIDQILESGFVKKDKNNAEIQVLTQLRDTLLPQLISGRVRIPQTIS